MHRSIKKYKTASYMTSLRSVFYILGVATILLASCKAGKQPVRRKTKMIDNKSYGVITVDTMGGKATVVTGSTTKPATTTTLNNDKLAVIDKIKPLLKNQIQFSTFSGKAKMHYQAQGQKNEFTANFRIKKDQVIWVAVQALGGLVNVARVYVRPDSVFLINYLERDAYKMPIADINKLLPVPVDFATMQNLIVGNAIDEKGTPTDATDFGGTMSIQLEDGGLTQQITYNKADNTMRTMQMHTGDNGAQGMIQYGNYEDANGRKFSTSRVININNNGEQYYLDMNFNSVDFDKQQDYPFSIPKGYSLK
ncbi:MAG: DUF4292 domain-containing protein [Sphingobacteriales bacterium]|nr:MAG: DUF4292 domain-containing protein [Sphingobacteriales bacterium]